jgi:hypothetical protein
VICTLFILGHIFTFKHLCLHSITKILRNGPKAHFPFTSAQRGAKKKAKKKSQAKRDAADADLVAIAEHRNPRKPPGGANLFDKMLKELCPYH